MSYLYIDWKSEIFAYLHIVYTRKTKKALSQMSAFCLSVMLVNVFLFAFQKKTGEPNLMKPCTKLADIPISNVRPLLFRYFHRFKKAAICLI